MKTIILSRVSTEEQKEANNSLPAQTFRLRKYAQERGLKIYKEFEFDESAYKIKREEFSEVMEELKTAPEKMAILCDKVDRLIKELKLTPEQIIKTIEESQRLINEIDKKNADQTILNKITTSIFQKITNSTSTAGCVAQ